MELVDRFHGCLLGLAVGDAVGTALEFRSPGSFKPIDDMVSGGPFRLKPGQWTDDTSMALCLAESLIECQKFNPIDQLERYVRWWRSGHLSSTGTCFDIGGTTAAALGRFERKPEALCGTSDPWAAGNGSIMRLAPVPMCFANDPAAAIERAADSSRTTHCAETCVDACRYLAGLIVGAIRGESRETLLASRYTPIPSYWDQHPLTPEIDEIASGSFKRKEPPEIQGTGHVVKTLEAALWAFDRSDSFREGCLKAVNLGDDADTTGAVFGELAGAYYGESGIPDAWLERLAEAEMIRSFSDRLLQLGSRRT